MPAASSPADRAISGAPAMSPLLVVLVLALLLGIQPVTTDLYLPALPTITESFGAPVSQSQLTLSTLMLAFGTSQLVWGPLSDRFGRRPVLLMGLIAYTLASVGAVVASSMALLITWRTVQGAAIGATVMGGRAIIRDLYAPQLGARVMSMALTGLGVIACLSPPIGGLLTDGFGWRYALLALAVFGALTLALVAARFEETVPRKNPAALNPGTLLRTWVAIVRHPTFIAYSTLSLATYAGLFTFLGTSSFVFIKVLGYTRLQYSMALFTMAFSYVLGTFLCRRLLLRLGIKRSVAVGGLLSLTGGTLLGVLALAGVRGYWAILAPFMIYMVGHGVHQPCGNSGAVGPFPRAAGTASALNGFFMMLTAFAVGEWIGPRLDGTVFTLTNGVWFWSVCVALAAWTLVRRHGGPA